MSDLQQSSQQPFQASPVLPPSFLCFLGLRGKFSLMSNPISHASFNAVTERPL